MTREEAMEQYKERNSEAYKEWLADEWEDEVGEVYREWEEEKQGEWKDSDANQSFENFLESEEIELDEDTEEVA